MFLLSDSPVLRRQWRAASPPLASHFQKWNLMVIKVACRHVTNLQWQGNGYQHVEENVNFLNSTAKTGTKGTLIYHELVVCGDTGAVNNSLPQGLWVTVPLNSVRTEGFYSCRGRGVEIEKETRQWVVRSTCLLLEQRFKVALPFRNYDNRCVHVCKAKAWLQWEEREDVMVSCLSLTLSLGKLSPWQFSLDMPRASGGL